MATAREPIEQAGYISATSDIPQSLSCKPQPVHTCRVWDFDAVYSAHFARYGAIPAALRQAPGTISELALTWLDAAELTRMHETEALGFNYDYGIAKGLRLEPELGPVPDRVYAYIGHRGYLDHAGAPVALAEVAAEGRTVPALA